MGNTVFRPRTSAVAALLASTAGMLAAAAVLSVWPLQWDMAQHVAPVIYLTPAETAKAKRLAQNAKDTETRQRLARTAWRDFYNSYQALHPELSHLRFTSDFKLALGDMQSYPVDEIITVTLSKNEREKAETLYQTMTNAVAAEPVAQNAWMKYQYELADSHFPPKGIMEGVGLPDGTQVRVAPGWDRGLAFTRDFRVAVPKP